MKHAAFNLLTGELITTDSTNQLNRMVQHFTQWDRRYFPENPHKWVFAHGKDWNGKIREKIKSYSDKWEDWI